MPLWDRLPPEERRRYIDTRLTPGRVLLLHCDFTTPPKDKFLLLTCLDPEPLFFIINSAINEYIHSREWLLRCQVEIGHEDIRFWDTIRS